MNVSMDDTFKALHIISQICTENKDCKSCPFYTGEICGITGQGSPSYWSIKVPKIELFD